MSLFRYDPGILVFAALAALLVALIAIDSLRRPAARPAPRPTREARLTRFTSRFDIFLVVAALLLSAVVAQWVAAAVH